MERKWVSEQEIGGKMEEEEEQCTKIGGEIGFERNRS